MTSTPPPDSKAAPPAKAGFFSRRPAKPAADKPSKPTPKPPRRSRGGGLGAFSAVLSLLLLGAIIGLAGFGYAFLQATKAGPLKEDMVVNIDRDEDSGTIAEQLEGAGVIESATWFSLITLLDGTRSTLKRGEYAFKAGESIRQIEAQLAAGKVVQHKLPIPEGLTSDQIVQRIRDADFLSGEIREPPKEGSLIAETYDFPRDASRKSVLLRLQREQTKLVADIWQKRAADLPIKSPGELVTLASIVEKETGKPDERPHVAGVFMNRLNKHMKLQSDPTIVYELVFGKGTLGHSITKAELETATPYNTYVIDGLPPGPICNPGRAALEAVANPIKTKDLYFVADGTGGHAFAETIEQHLKNVAAYRQIQQDAKDRIAPDVNADLPPTPAPTGTPGGKGKPHADAEPVDPKVSLPRSCQCRLTTSRRRSPRVWPSLSRASVRSTRWLRSLAPQTCSPRWRRRRPTASPMRFPQAWQSSPTACAASIRRRPPMRARSTRGFLSSPTARAMHRR